jgi:uncharacterized protein
MESKIYSETEFLSNDWAGGSTKQLFIHPENATYQSRDFDLRISIAKIDLEESVFTSLPGIDRKLLVLEGGMSIDHEGFHSGSMKKFDVDNFQGDWTTRSIGKCTDFNVMTNSKWESHLFGLNIEEGGVEMIPFGGIKGKLFVYLHKGSVDVETEIDNFHLEEGTFLQIDFNRMHELQIRAIDQSELVVTIVQKV